MNLKYFHERANKELNDFRDLFNLTAAEKHISLGDLNVQPDADADKALLKDAEPSHEDSEGDQDKKQEELKILVAYRKVFLEICYLNRIKPHEAKDYEIFLKKRIVDIEETITSHFRLLYETLESKYKEEYKKQRKKKEAIQVLTLQQQWKLEQEDEKALK